MGKFIDEAVTILNDSFKENWEYAFNFHINPANEDSTSQEYLVWKAEHDSKSEEFKNWLNQLKESIFEKLNCSLLTGEYIDSNNFPQKVTSLIVSLNSIPSPGTAFDLIQTKIKDNLKEDFIDCIKVANDMYLSLFNLVKLRNQVDGKDYIATIDFEFRKEINKHEFGRHSTDLLHFLSLNIQLANEDHFLTPEITHLRSLQEIEFAINELPANKLAILITEKCKFLISKWILRREELTKDPVFITSGGKTIELSTDKLNCNLLVRWKSYIESHYEIGKSLHHHSKIKDDFFLTKDKKLSTCSMEDLHRKIKYFKDVKKDLKNLNNIRREIGKRWAEQSTNTTINDKYVLSLAYLYALNNEFSFIIDEKKHSLKQIDNFYSEIIEFQNSTGLKNFFAQYKYLEYLVKRLKIVFENRNAFTTLKESKEIITICDKVLFEYKDHIEWSEKNYNYVFLLPLKESEISVTNEKLDKIYISSSFALPLSKNKYKSEFEENRRDFHTYKSSIEVFENLERDIKDTQKRELRSMEIIGIFTAIVTFIATSIPSFKFIETPYQAAIFMFALASSLGLFVLMIIISSRGIHKLKEHWKVAFGFLLASVGAWVGLIIWSGDPKMVNNQEQKIIRLADSIYKSKNQPTVVFSVRPDTIIQRPQEKKVVAPKKKNSFNGKKTN